MDEKQLKEAQEHLELSQKHAKFLEELGESINQSQSIKSGHGERIKAAGKAILKRSRAGEKYVQPEHQQPADLTENYCKAAQEHSKAVNEMINASGEFLEVIKERIDKNKESLKASQQFSQNVEQHIQTNKETLDEG